MTFSSCACTIILILCPIFLHQARPLQAACDKQKEFQCRSDPDQCIPVQYTCDGDSDCYDTSDEEGCRKEKFSDNFLIVADSERQNLFQVGLDNGEMVPLLPFKIRRPIAVSFDEVNKDVYWTDVSHRSIARYSLRVPSSSVQTIFISSDATSALDGLAIDSTSQRLFYCDAGDVGKIGSMLTNGSQQKLLVQAVGMKPRSIVLDTANRFMYWSDWGNRSSISRANMDTGAQAVVLVSGGMMLWPNALAIDFQAQRMYFGDAGLGTIQSARLDGGDRRLIYDNRGDHYFAFFLTPQYIYATDWNKRAVRRLNRTSLTMSDQPPAVFGRLAGIAASIGATDSRTPPITSTTTTVQTSPSSRNVEGTNSKQAVRKTVARNDDTAKQRGKPGIGSSTQDKASLFSESSHD